MREYSNDKARCRRKKFQLLYGKEGGSVFNYVTLQLVFLVDWFQVLKTVICWLRIEMNGIRIQFEVRFDLIDGG